MIELKKLSKSFTDADNTVHAVKEVDLTIEDGDIFGIIGMSGAGKSTLVRCINMLERPSEGDVLIDGVSLSSLSEKELREKRREIAMIFQSFNLLMQRNCLQNVCFPMELAGIRPSEARKKAKELLETVGLGDKVNAYPSQLSGGQQQRVAIARALATGPKVLLCDEATSALDPATTRQILDLIRDINRKYGITVIIITHQMSVVESICQHVAILDQGRVVEQGSVQDVFSDPVSAAAKALVFPEGYLDVLESGRKGSRYLRVVFDGSQATDTPLIAKMAVEKGIIANIAYASTREIGGRTFGSMLLSIEEKNHAFQEALAYFSDAPGVSCGEVMRDAE